MPSLALAVLLLLASVAAPAHAQESWLDGPITDWNTPGQSIPDAPAPLAPPDARCLMRARPPETAEDQALVDAGWILFNAYRAGWGIIAIDATSGYDGMCRPSGYQIFVFADGVFAGTASSEPMDSRSTGAGNLFGFDADTLSVTFRRYAPTDPLCCPSLPSVVLMERVDRTPDGPVLRVTSRT